MISFIALMGCCAVVPGHAFMSIRFILSTFTFSVFFTPDPFSPSLPLDAHVPHSKRSRPHWSGSSISLSLSLFLSRLLSHLLPYSCPRAFQYDSVSTSLLVDEGGTFNIFHKGVMPKCPFPHSVSVVSHSPSNNPKRPRRFHNPGFPDAA